MENTLNHRGMGFFRLLIVSMAALGTLISGAAAERLVIAGATIIDGTGAEPIQGHSLIVQDQRIVDLVPDGSVVRQAEDRWIDADGLYLLPGLWDMHIHVSFNEDLAPRMFAYLLAHGVTGIRDVGGDLEKSLYWRDRARKNPRAAPRLAIAGPLIDGFPTVYDGSAPNRPNLSVTIRNAEETMKTIERLAEAEVDFLKAYEMLSEEAFEALMQRAADHDLKVAGHVPFSITADRAAELGIGSIEHLRNVEMATSSMAQELLQERKQMLAAGKDLQGGDLRSRIHRTQRPRAIASQDPAATQQVIDAFAKHQTTQVPTLVIMAGSRVRMDQDPGFLPLLQNMPDSLREPWLEIHQRLQNMDAAQWAPHHELGDWMLAFTRQAYEAGIPILPGTDSPVPLALPGHSLHEELRGLVLAGIPEMSVIQAATLESARWLGLEGETGSIQPGKAADLILVRSNPLEDIHATRDLHSVIRAGRHYDRDTLSTMLSTGRVPD